MTRKIAANHINTPDANITLGVVEIEGDIVRRYYPLEAEQPFTEWIGGSITIRRTPQGLQAFKSDRLITA